MRGLMALLRMRKQSDKVKLALLLFLLGAVLAWDVLSGAAGYFSAAGEPVEYILVSSSQGARLESGLQAIRQRDSVVAAGRQREYTLTSDERSLEVVEVTPEYLGEGFGIIASGSGKEYYLGRGAFFAFCGRSAQSPVRLTCLAGEERVSGTFILDEGLPSGLAVTKGSSATLGSEQTLRVMLRGRDMSGVETQWLEGNGFAIENREEVERAAYEGELLMVRLRYGGAACVLAVLLGTQLFKAGSREAGAGAK